MSLRFTILGCGSSGGVPRIGGDWGDCDPTNPKNRRRRCSIMVEKISSNGTTRVIIDTSPDLREQMLDQNVGEIDGVWYTHEHADHTHGVDDLRAFFLRHRKRVPIWADVATAKMLRTRFNYCFERQPDSDYPPILDHHLLTPNSIVNSGGVGGDVSGTAFEVPHGNIQALGFRVSSLAYTPDLNAIPPSAEAHLNHLEVWIVDALRPTPHPSHFSLPETLQWIQKLKPKRAILTNLHVDMDYESLCKSLPPGVEPAYDGMQITLD